MSELADATKNDDARLTARDVSIVIRRFAKLFEVEPLKSDSLYQALLILERKLYQAGHQPLEDLSFSKKSQSALRYRPQVDYREVPTGSLKEIIAQPELPKSYLIEIAYSRFKIPKARLMRLKREEVVTKLKSAAENEESLDIIASNAAESGKSRTS